MIAELGTWQLYLARRAAYAIMAAARGRRSSPGLIVKNGAGAGSLTCEGTA
jgi:hypothetical protein